MPPKWVRSCRPIVGFARAGKSEKHGWPRAPCPAAKARYSGPLTRGGRINIMERLIGLLGIVVLLAIAVLFSSNRRWIRLRIVIPAFLLHAGFAILVLCTPWGRAVIPSVSNGVSGSEERRVGKRVSVSVYLGGRRIIKKNKRNDK